MVGNSIEMSSVDISCVNTMKCLPEASDSVVSAQCGSGFAASADAGTSIVWFDADPWTTSLPFSMPSDCTSSSAIGAYWPFTMYLVDVPVISTGPSGGCEQPVAKKADAATAIASRGSFIGSRDYRRRRGCKVQGAACWVPCRVPGAACRAHCGVLVDRGVRLQPALDRTGAEHPARGTQHAPSTQHRAPGTYHS